MAMCCKASRGSLILAASKIHVAFFSQSSTANQKHVIDSMHSIHMIITKTFKILHSKIYSLVAMIVTDMHILGL